MGCTPSIHVQQTQTGMVICRTAEDSTSPHHSQGIANKSTSPAVNAAPDDSTVLSAHMSKRMDGNNLSFGNNPGVSSNEQWTESDAYTTSCRCKMGDNTMVQLGPMQFKQQTMTVLLVFAREDAQSDALWWAADRGNYKCNLQRTAEGALESYLDKQHDVVIIDARSSKAFDADALCRSLKATKHSEHTVMVAVTKKSLHGREEASILPLLKSGFTRRIQECGDINSCLNELQSLEYGEVRLQARLRAANALLAAAENCNDAIEITNEEHVIEYVNPAYERLHGYTCEELIGKDARDLFHVEDSHSDLHDCINSHLRKGKIWEGIHYSQRKSGECFSHRTHTSPVPGRGGEPRHFVSIKVPLGDHGSQYFDRFHGESSQAHLAGAFHGNRLRRESITRIQSMTIEAPITKVINIINSAQESCPNTVVQALDKVLEILRSSELYSPYIGQTVKEDPITNDLVGGLMTNNVKKFSSMSDAGHSTRSSNYITSSPARQGSFTTMVHMTKDVQNTLEKEPQWDFDILQLEKVTKKRPMLFLGLKTFERFGVMEFLRISEKELVSWLQVIEANYHRSNSYHNSTHAADVMHATAYFLSRDKCKMVFDKTDEVAALIAALVHDLDHPGKTNSYLVNDGSQLAVLYNDLAVLESHHASMAFQLTQRDARVNIFKNVDKDTFRTLRQQIVDMVLATEMTKHFEHLNKFIGSINQSSSKDDERSSISGSNTPDSSLTRLSQPENKTLIKRMLIKCADVSNPARPLEACTVWAQRIAEEYCNQTEDEKSKGLPVVMPIFDKKTCNVPKSQISFIDFFINNMFDAWDSFCDVPELIKHIKDNYQHWKDQEEAADREIAERLRAEATITSHEEKS